MSTLVLTALAVLITSPPAGADDFVYLVNITMRPGYHFASQDAALAYGHGICSKVVANTAYSQLLTDIESDLDNPDEYHASYLVTQAVNELCPDLIWQLRNSAAGHRPQDIG
ncbi:DUF732 domain-containing protein [Mycobacteroides abscessus]|uniref:DUF732 domain-containing protein n=1 Tax=Mycobacteroides abscessus TaxID=36809 RepID=UPI001F4657B0|nr:DUF732 domain-containing protein [Mycobacteroides abscessus]